MEGINDKEECESDALKYLDGAMTEKRWVERGDIVPEEIEEVPPPAVVLFASGVIVTAGDIIYTDDVSWA